MSESKEFHHSTPFFFVNGVFMERMGLVEQVFL